LLEKAQLTIQKLRLS